ncbi:MAG: efflux RND transporter permease subunit [Pirellulaceae bacterium]
MILLELLANLVTRWRWLAGSLIVIATVLAGFGLFYSPQPQSSGGGADKPPARREQAADNAVGGRTPATAAAQDSSDEGNDVDDADEPKNTGARLRVATSDFDRRPADCFLVVQIDDLFNPRTVDALRSVVSTVESLPYVDSMTWVDTVPVLNVFGLREPLLPPADASQERFDDARQRVMDHPLIIGQLLSDDGKTLLMPVSFDWLQVTSDEDCTTGLLSTARQAADETDVAMRIELTGRVPLYLAHQQAFDRNQSRFQIIAYGLVFILALILFRGFRAVMICALAPALGVFWSLGLLNWMDELTNPLTNVVLPVLLTMVGLTDGIHIMVHIRRARAAGVPSAEAARSAIRQVGLACALTSLTTAIGFGSLLVAESEFVQGFGRGCAIGVVVTFFAVVVFIPLVSGTWIGNNIHRGHEHDLVGRGMKRSGGVIDFVLRHNRLVSVVAVASTLLFALIASRLRPDDRMADSQPTGSAAYKALAHCDRALGGIEFVRVMIQWPEQLAEDDPTILAAVQDVQQMLDDEELLRHPLSILSVLSALPGDESPTSRLPFLQLLPDSVKQAYFDAHTQRALVTVRIQDLGIARYEPVFKRVEANLADLAGKYDGFQFELTGDPVKRGRNLYRIVVDLAASLGTASIIIFFVMAIVYRSLRLGIISVIPNVFPLVVTASMMVLLNHPLEIASVCSFTVCLGIAVDDTIHFLTRYQEEVATDGDIQAAIRRSFHGVGSAMIITTVILVTGFGTVLTSDLPGHRYFAAMAVSTIGAALIGDLIFLPALLATFPPKRRRRKGAVDATRTHAETA